MLSIFQCPRNSVGCEVWELPLKKPLLVTLCQKWSFLTRPPGSLISQGSPRAEPLAKTSRSSDSFFWRRPCHRPAQAAICRRTPHVSVGLLVSLRRSRHERWHTGHVFTLLDGDGVGSRRCPDRRAAGTAERDLGGLLRCHSAAVSPKCRMLRSEGMSAPGTSSEISLTRAYRSGSQVRWRSEFTIFKSCQQLP